MGLVGARWKRGEYNLMRTFLDCIPCFVNQALRGGRLTGLSEEETRRLLFEVTGRLSSLGMEKPPPQNAVFIYDLISSYTGMRDPFRKIKEESTQKALSLYPRLREIIDQCDDPLASAIRLAIAGNVIDFGVGKKFDIDHEINKVLTGSSPLWDEDLLKTSIKKAAWILYLGDNSGETVFDRLLIETMAKPVKYVVRENPIINDATYDDAVAAGLEKVAEIISSGCSAPGILTDQCSTEFRRLFHDAPLVISKGQGNFETLSDETRPIFFLLKAKCEVVASFLKVEVGDTILTCNARTQGLAGKQGSQDISGSTSQN